MKQVNYEVILTLAEDDATGVWGLAHESSRNHGFNSFWNPDGVFHDVFEHYFEGRILPYFLGRNAYQLWGEMCASGHAIVYADLGINNFRYRKSSSRDFTLDTTTHLIDWLAGYRDELDYGIEHFAVPYQKRMPDPNLQYWLRQYEDFWYNQRDKGRDKIKQVKFGNIVRAYTYGFKTAQAIIGEDKEHAYNVFDKFLTDWNDITHANPQELYIDGSEFGIHGFKFTVSNNGKLNVNTVVLDDLRQEHPIESLIVY